MRKWKEKYEMCTNMGGSGEIWCMLKNIRGLLVGYKKEYYLCGEIKKKEESMNEKIQINIYKGLPMVLEKIKAVALAAVIGKYSSWLKHKQTHYVIKGRAQEFVESDIPLINNGLQMLGEEISSNLVNYSSDRDEVIKQVKQLDQFVSMPYIYTDIMKKNRAWYAHRMSKRTPEGKACSFKEDDILQINMAAMQIANELRSIEFIL